LLISVFLEGPVTRAWNILKWWRSQYPDMEECCEYVQGVTDNRQEVVGSPTEEGDWSGSQFPTQGFGFGRSIPELPTQRKSGTKKIK